MRHNLFAAVAGFGFGVASAYAQPVFEPRPAPEHQYTGGWEHFVGGGVAAFDCDSDLLPDLYAAGGETPAVLMRNRTEARGAQLRFVEETPDALSLTGVTGAYPLDVDGDAILDLVILRVGENQLLRGQGDCRFAPFDAALGFQSGDRWTTAFSATWEAGQALPTLAFGNYVDRTDPDGPFEACDASMLYRPDGARYSAPAPLAPGFCTLSMLFSDWGRNGRADLRMSNDRHYYVRGGSEQMWAMEPTPRLYTEAEGWQRQQLWGMGIAARDLTGDGLSEVFLTSMGDQILQSLQGDGSRPEYINAPYARGTTAQRPYTGGDGRPSTGWQVSFGDVDNDGRDDVFIAKGNVDQMPGSAMDDPNNLLVQQGDGRFEEMGADAGIASMARGRGAALVDLNLDGQLDLVVVNRRAPLELYENETENAGSWLLLAPEQDGANRNAVGAFLEVRAGEKRWSREITVGGGHASGSAGFAHFGLGFADRAEVRVIWPDGATSDWQAVAVNQVLTLARNGTDLSVAAR